MEIAALIFSIISVVITICIFVLDLFWRFPRISLEIPFYTGDIVSGQKQITLCMNINNSSSLPITISSIVVTANKQKYELETSEALSLFPIHIDSFHSKQIFMRYTAAVDFIDFSQNQYVDCVIFTSRKNFKKKVLINGIKYVSHNLLKKTKNNFKN